LVVAFGAGWAVALVVPIVFGWRVPSDWFQMNASATSKGFVPDASASKAVTYAFDAFARADIPLPEIKAVNGVAKFVADSSTAPHLDSTESGRRSEWLVPIMRFIATSARSHRSEAEDR